MYDFKEYEGMSLLDQLNHFRNKYRMDGYSNEQGILAVALDTLLPQIATIVHIRSIKFADVSGSHEADRYAVYDDRSISAERVRECISQGEEYHPCIAYMDEEQLCNIFWRMGVPEDQTYESDGFDEMWWFASEFGDSERKRLGEDFLRMKITWRTANEDQDELYIVSETKSGITGKSHWLKRYRRDDERTPKQIETDGKYLYKFMKSSIPVTRCLRGLRK